jgi:hypothetical protein
VVVIAEWCVVDDGVQKKGLIVAEWFEGKKGRGGVEKTTSHLTPNPSFFLILRRLTTDLFCGWHVDANVKRSFTPNVQIVESINQTIKHIRVHLIVIVVVESVVVAG